MKIGAEDSPLPSPPVRADHAILDDDLSFARCGNSHNRKGVGEFRLIREPSSARPSRKPWIGGADRDRTDDPLLAKQMLSQLSYSPNGLVAFVANGGPR